jgi:DNA helicase MCM9
MPKCEHINKLVSITGTVVKASVARILETAQEYVCIKCSTEFHVEIDLRKESLMVKPTRCPKENCKSAQFKIINSDGKFFVEA